MGLDQKQNDQLVAAINRSKNQDSSDGYTWLICFVLWGAFSFICGFAMRSHDADSQVLVYKKMLKEEREYNNYLYSEIMKSEFDKRSTYKNSEK